MELPAKLGGEELGLVEFAAALFDRMERDRHDGVNVRPIDPTMTGLAKPGGEVWEEILFPAILEAVDAITDDAVSPAGGDGAGEMEFQILTVAAVDLVIEFAIKWERAAPAKWRFDQLGATETGRADDPGVFFEQRGRTELAVARVDEVDRAVEPFQERRQRRTPRMTRTGHINMLSTSDPPPHHCRPTGSVSLANTFRAITHPACRPMER